MVDSVGSMSSYFTSLIDSIMKVEREPLNRLTESRNTINLQKAIYSDIGVKLNALKSAADKLTSTDAFYALKPGRTATVTPGQSGTTVLSASASASANVGIYTVEVNQIAKAQSLRSDALSGDPLMKQGTITINGKDITIETSDTLATIADKINSTTFDDGKGVGASVIGSGNSQYLVFTSAATGTAGQMTISQKDQNGNAATLINLTTLTDPQDAKIKVNGLPTVDYITSSSNTITTAVSGLTINLASDAAGKTATINVGRNATDAKSAIETFVSAYNDLQLYLESKTSVTKNDDGTYTRGVLASDSIFIDLRDNLFNGMMRQTGGTYDSMMSIGITLSSSLQLTFTDTTKFEKALTDNPNAVKDLFDNVVGNISNTLSRFGGTDGYLDKSTSSLSYEINSMDADIKSMEERMLFRKQSLTDQYAAIAQQLISMQYEAQTWSSIYSSTTSTSA